MSARAVRLTLLDGFDLRVGDESALLSRSCQRLVAFLALRDGPLLRPYVAGTLWIDGTEEHAAGSLRSTLWRLHQATVLAGVPVSRRTAVTDQATMVWSRARVLTILSGPSVETTRVGPIGPG